MCYSQNEEHRHLAQNTLYRRNMQKKKQLCNEYKYSPTN